MFLFLKQVGVSCERPYLKSFMDYLSSKKYSFASFFKNILSLFDLFNSEICRHFTWLHTWVHRYLLLILITIIKIEIYKINWFVLVCFKYSFNIAYSPISNTCVTFSSFKYVVFLQMFSVLIYNKFHGHLVPGLIWVQTMFVEWKYSGLSKTYI